MPYVWRTGKWPVPGLHSGRMLALHLPAAWELFAALFTFKKIALQWKESLNPKTVILMSHVSCRSKKRRTTCLHAYIHALFPPALPGWVRRVGNQWKLLIIAIKRTEKNKKINWEIPLAVSFPRGKFQCVYVTNLMLCLVLPLAALLPSGIILMRIMWKLCWYPLGDLCRGLS